MRSRTTRDRGASAVEFALVLPVLILVLFGIIDFGFAFFNQIQLTSVAREGVRTAVVLPGSASGPIVTRATEAAPGMTGLSVVVASSCPTAPSAGATARVEANQDHQWLLLGPLLGYDKDLTATAVMQCGG